jgi:hypothetical protein
MVLLIINGTKQQIKPLNKRKKPLNLLAKNIMHVTSDRQKKNGTFAVKCLKTGAIYTSHANGYVRRETLNANGKRIQYQLNPVCKISGNRIMLDEIERFEKIVDAIDSYILTVKNRINK